MNVIDNNISLSEQFHPINFETFQCGDEYVIARIYKDDMKYYIASVDYFRHGIAIVHTSNGDCLINTHCVIIFEEHANSRRSDITINRTLDGFKISWEEDVAAPGKDFQWRDKECIIPEHQIVANAYEIYNTHIYDYPWGIAPEKGLIIRFDNNFYDFETYDLLFSIPKTLQLCKESICNIYNVYADCDYIKKKDVQIYTNDEFDKFIVKDTKYYKNIIVKVQGHKIVSWYPLPGIEEQPLKDISYQNHDEKIDMDPFKGLASYKYIKYIFSNDNRELGSHINRTFNLFSQFPELKTGIDAYRELRQHSIKKLGKEYVGVINGERIQLIIRLLDAGFVIFNYSDYRREILSKYYVFDRDGNILNLSGYDDIDVALLASSYEYEVLIFNRGNDYGIANIGLYGSKIELREKVIYSYDKDSEERETPIYPPVGIEVVGRPIDCRRPGKKLLEDRFYLRDIEQEKASAIGVYKWIAINYGFGRDFSETTFYAGLPYLLSKVDVDKELELTPLIEGYLYQLPNKQKASKYVKICNQIFYREFYRAYSTDTIKHATKESVEKTQKQIDEYCSKGSPYVVRIKEIKKFCDSYTQYYLFEYRPFGKIDSNGNITYEFGDPQDIKL